MSIVPVYSRVLFYGNYLFSILREALMLLLETWSLIIGGGICKWSCDQFKHIQAIFPISRNDTYTTLNLSNNIFNTLKIGIMQSKSKQVITGNWFAVSNVNSLGQTWHPKTLSGSSETIYWFDWTTALWIDLKGNICRVTAVSVINKTLHGDLTVPLS